MTGRRFHFAGRVQGVGFRYTVKRIAAGYEVIGWVRNLPDGRVELSVSGESGEIDQFLAAIAESHLGGHIRERAESEPAEDEAPLTVGFEIRR